MTEKENVPEEEVNDLDPEKKAWDMEKSYHDNYDSTLANLRNAQEQMKKARIDYEEDKTVDVQGAEIIYKSLRDSLHGIEDQLKLPRTYVSE